MAKWRGHDALSFLTGLRDDQSILHALVRWVAVGKLVESKLGRCVFLPKVEFGWRTDYAAWGQFDLKSDY